MKSYIIQLTKLLSSRKYHLADLANSEKCKGSTTFNKTKRCKSYKRRPVKDNKVSKTNYSSVSS